MRVSRAGWVAVIAAALQLAMPGPAHSIHVRTIGPWSVVAGYDGGSKQTRASATFAFDRSSSFSIRCHGQVASVLVTSPVLADYGWGDGARLQYRLDNGPYRRVAAVAGGDGSASFQDTTFLTRLARAGSVGFRVTPKMGSASLDLHGSPARMAEVFKVVMQDCGAIIEQARSTVQM